MVKNKMSRFYGSLCTLCFIKNVAVHLWS